MRILLNKILILILCLCFIPTLKAKKIPASFSQEKNNIQVSVRLLTKTDVQNLFNCYNPVKVARLINHYKILEISIENKTAQEFVLAQENIDLKIENSLVIKSKVKASPVIIPLCTVAVAITLFTVGLGFAVLPSVIAGSAIGITTLNINMQKSNKISTKSIQAKVLDKYNPSLIPSYSKIQKVIFVATKNAKESFGLTLESVALAQKVPFNVILTY